MKVEDFSSKRVELPIGVVLTVAPCIWELRKTACRKTLEPHSGVRQRARYAFFGKRKHIHALPLKAMEYGMTLERRPQWSSVGAFLDAWKVRDEFLSLKSEAEFLGFLNKIGRFSRGFARDGDWELSDLKGWQQVFRKFLISSPATWHDHLVKLAASAPGFNLRLIDLDVAVSLKTSFQLHLSWQRRSAVIRVVDAVSAILASIYIDHLRGLRLRFCARPDCRKPFEITSRHKRKYCEQYCAHLEALRRMRRKTQ